MLNIIFGVLSGIISGTGMGGGTLLIFLLITINGLNLHVAQACNLIFFIPTSIAAIIVNIKNKNIDYKLACIIILFGIIGAIIGAQIAVNTNTASLKKYYGVFILLITINEIRLLVGKK